MRQRNPGIARVVDPLKGPALDREVTAWFRNNVGRNGDPALTGSLAVRSVYRRRAHDLLYKFLPRTWVVLGATAAQMAVPMWEAYPTARRAVDDWDPHYRQFDDTAPRRGVAVLEQALAGYPVRSVACELGRRCMELRATAEFVESTFDCDGAGDAAECVGVILTGFDFGPGLAGSCAECIALMITAGLPSPADADKRADRVDRWWAACTRRLAFKDVFTAEIELGDPPEPWPGDDPAHLARVTAWEAMSDDDRLGMIERHRRQRGEDAITLRSGRTIQRETDV